MTMTPLQVIALALRVSQAAGMLDGLTQAECEEAATFQLSQRGTTQCLCGTCPPNSPETDKALEAAAAFLIAAGEFIGANNLAVKRATAALSHLNLPKKP